MIKANFYLRSNLSLIKASDKPSNFTFRCVTFLFFIFVYNLTPYFQYIFSDVQIFTNACRAFYTTFPWVHNCTLFVRYCVQSLLTGCPRHKTFRFDWQDVTPDVSLTRAQSHLFVNFAWCNPLPRCHTVSSYTLFLSSWSLSTQTRFHFCMYSSFKRATWNTMVSEKNIFIICELNVVCADDYTILRILVPYANK